MSKIVFSWSGGKDSALALYHALNDPNLEVAKLMTVIDGSSKEVNLHGMSEEHIKEQADAIDLPIDVLYVPFDENNGEAYIKLLQDYCVKIKQEGITGMGFGDIFLEDLKEYRVNQLAAEGLDAYFPLWKRGSLELIDEFWNMGFKTRLCSGNISYFNKKDIGNYYTKTLMEGLPSEVDVCGENGEFHSFVVDGPIFKEEIKLELTEVYQRDYTFNTKEGKQNSSFWYAKFK